MPVDQHIEIIKKTYESLRLELHPTQDFSVDTYRDGRVIRIGNFILCVPGLKTKTEVQAFEVKTTNAAFMQPPEIISSAEPEPEQLNKRPFIPRAALERCARNDEDEGVEYTLPPPWKEDPPEWVSAGGSKK